MTASLQHRPRRTDGRQAGPALSLEDGPGATAVMIFSHHTSRLCVSSYRPAIDACRSFVCVDTYVT